MDPKLEDFPRARSSSHETASRQQGASGCLLFGFSGELRVKGRGPVVWGAECVCIYIYIYMLRHTYALVGEEPFVSRLSAYSGVDCFHCRVVGMFRV